MSDEFAKGAAAALLLAVDESEAAARREVERIVAEVRPVLERDQRSAEDLHRLVDACLRLRALAGPWGFAEEAARKVGAALVGSCLGWTEPQDRPATAESWDALRADPARWRGETWSRLRRAPTPLPGVLLADLCEALLDLNEGHGEPPALLAPVAPDGRGANPAQRREAEELLWQWIEAQAVQGQRREAAKAAVADVAGVTVKAVEKWREEWQRRAGRAAVEQALSLVAEGVRAGQLRDLLAPDFLRAMAAVWKAARMPEKSRRQPS